MWRRNWETISTNSFPALWNIVAHFHLIYLLFTHDHSLSDSLWIADQWITYLLLLLHCDTDSDILSRRWNTNTDQLIILTWLSTGSLILFYCEDHHKSNRIWSDSSFCISLYSMVVFNGYLLLLFSLFVSNDIHTGATH